MVSPRRRHDWLAPILDIARKDPIWEVLQGALNQGNTMVDYSPHNSPQETPVTVSGEPTISAGHRREIGPLHHTRYAGAPP
jgi:hypothetical protein